jgi:undecaprenyl-diphosphatase
MLSLVHADEQVFLALNRALSGRALDALFSIVTWLGNGAVLAALILPPMYARSRSTLRAHLVPMALAVALGGLAVCVAKPMFDRPRPPEHFAALDVPVSTPLGVPPDRSFPSGHAQTAFGAAVYLSLLFRRGAAGFLALAALVGLSRIALGVHYPSDVLIGAAVGSMFSITAFLIARRCSGRKLKDP